MSIIELKDFVSGVSIDTNRLSLSAKESLIFGWTPSNPNGRGAFSPSGRKTIAGQGNGFSSMVLLASECSVFFFLL